jgi:hypothetical protein
VLDRMRYQEAYLAAYPCATGREFGVSSRKTGMESPDRGDLFERSGRGGRRGRGQGPRVRRRRLIVAGRKVNGGRSISTAGVIKNETTSARPSDKRESLTILD